MQGRKRKVGHMNKYKTNSKMTDSKLTVSIIALTLHYV